MLDFLPHNLILVPTGVLQLAGPCIGSYRSYGRMLGGGRRMVLDGRSGCQAKEPKRGLLLKGAKDRNRACYIAMCTFCWYRGHFLVSDWEMRIIEMQIVFPQRLLLVGTDWTKDGWANRRKRRRSMTRWGSIHLSSSVSSGFVLASQFMFSMTRGGSAGSVGMTLWDRNLAGVISVVLWGSDWYGWILGDQLRLVAFVDCTCRWLVTLGSS